LKGSNIAKKQPHPKNQQMKKKQRSDARPCIAQSHHHDGIMPPHRLAMPEEDETFVGDPAEREEYFEAAEVLTDETVDAPERPPGVGHTLIDRNAMIRAMAAMGNPKQLSTEDKDRAAFLVHLCERRDQLFRPHLVANTGMIERLQALDHQAPAFTELTTLIIRAAHLSLVSAQPLRLPPALLLGSPGTGKTRFVRKLASALDTPIDTVAGSTLPDVGSLLGYGKVWRGAGIGRICKTLLAASNSSPIVFIDEIEKIHDRDAPRPADRLLTLLEPHSAAAFLDEYLLVPMRADRVLWLMAANSLDGLSEPFLDRVVVINVPDLTLDQRERVLRSMLAEVAAANGLFFEAASADVLHGLRDLPLRRARLALELGVAAAVADGRRMLVKSDLAVDLLDRKRRSIGFVRH
jgi:ATP-dependent Lon protease